MPIFHVSYDLKTPGQNYDKLDKAIASVGSSYAHILGSTWLVCSTEAPKRIRERLCAALDQNDVFIITKVYSGDWASWNLDTKVAAWLEANA